MEHIEFSAIRQSDSSKIAPGKTSINWKRDEREKLEEREGGEKEKKKAKRKIARL